MKAIGVPEQQVSECKALDAFRDAKGRFDESRRNFFKANSIDVAAIGAGSMSWPKDTFAYGRPYASSFVLADDTLYMNIGGTETGSFAFAGAERRPFFSAGALRRQ